MMKKVIATKTTTLLVHLSARWRIMYLISWRERWWYVRLKNRKCFIFLIPTNSTLKIQKKHLLNGGTGYKWRWITVGRGSFVMILYFFICLIYVLNTWFWWSILLGISLFLCLLTENISSWEDEVKEYRDRVDYCGCKEVFMEVRETIETYIHVID